MDKKPVKKLDDVHDIPTKSQFGPGVIPSTNPIQQKASKGGFFNTAYNIFGHFPIDMQNHGIKEENGGDTFGSVMYDG